MSSRRPYRRQTQNRKRLEFDGDFVEMSVAATQAPFCESTTAVAPIRSRLLRRREAAGRNAPPGWRKATRRTFAGWEDVDYARLPFTLRSTATATLYLDSTERSPCGPQFQ
jgi:hypothetical protein